MSYQVLARKWRPQKFAELVGQEHVVSALSNALDNDKLHHAYLFTGTRGVGKTTIARIFSKSLNCETGQSATPCGVCDACRDIDEGRFVDLLEIDAASRTKVEDTRELLDNVQYKPTRGRFKVYLIDEVHMLSKHSFNALLKTLEEPPPHVKFLLATTDPQKLPVTILSRCLQFSLKALSREQIQKQLVHILTQESIPSDAIALSHLARAAQGSMRDALSLTDQAIAQGNNQITSQIVTDMLGLLDKNQVLRLVKAVIEKDSQEALGQLDEICVHAPDYSQVLSEILSLLHQVSLTQIVPDICKIETLSARAVYQLSKSVSEEHIQLLYQLVLQGKKDLPFAPDAFTGLQMTILRMLAFSPAQKIELDLESVHSDVLAEKKTADLVDASPTVLAKTSIT
ncbi:MAG: DNA polymerase-3 subunit gamma/tau, partial [Glaciecola sp.]